jgi:hypothetical protein
MYRGLDMGFDQDRQYDNYKLATPPEFEEEPTWSCLECGALLFKDDEHCDCEFCAECGELNKDCRCLEEMQ